MKNTKVNKSYSLKKVLFDIILCIVFSFIFAYITILIWNAPITETGLFQNNRIKILFMLVTSFLSIFIFVGMIGSITGIIKGKTVISKENNDAKNNSPYIYYRELPNNYGIGVATLLIDSTIENYKDVVAVILDLCARGYLKLEKQNDKYLVKVLKNIDDSLLYNEKYILDLILNNDIKNIDYQKWYNLCLQDGINLGIYNYRDVKINNINVKQTSDKKIVKVSLIIATIISLFYLVNGDFAMVFLVFVFSYFIMFLILIVFTIIKNMVFSIFFIGKMSKDIYYCNKLNSQLIRTPKGVQELQKLYSFKSFIEDFGYFVDKKPEEVIIWDRYLSYALLFGFTKEILATGYKQLVENASFQIDDIDNISLDNIEVSDKINL